MKHKNTDSGYPHNWRELAIFSLVVSLMAIAIASIALDIPFSEVSRDVAYNRVMTIAGLVIGVLGVAATVYFVVIGFEVHQYKIEIQRYKRVFEHRIKNIIAEVDKNVDAINKNEVAINSKDIDVLDVLSLIEGSSKDEKQTAVIRLAIGRMICKSETHSEEYPLEKGIMYLRQYSRSQEDIDLLNKIIAETDDERIKDMAAEAIKRIKERMGSN